MSSFPTIRLRRLRQSQWIRNLVQETTLLRHDLILPIIIRDHDAPKTIPSMPGINRVSLLELPDYIKTAGDLGIEAVALFPLINNTLKTPMGDEALNPKNLICNAARIIKKYHPHIGVIADVALDPYTTHGHDGIIENNEIHNDKTIDILCKQSLILAQSGVDVIAPSDMMDGRIGCIRHYLDDHGFENILLLSYAAKYASHFYGPYRDAIQTKLDGILDKKTYQMNPANRQEALREVELDIQEGADIVMVKPALPYLDVIADIKNNFSIPLFAFQVSGEYAMVMAAHNQGWVDGISVLKESLLSIKRAGACGILTYAALDIAPTLP
jgi:porphobilinogen synthase